MRIKQEKFSDTSNSKTIIFDLPVTHLGIQAYPGYTFIINNSPWTISVGRTGIYELNLLGVGKIKQLELSKFAPPEALEGKVTEIIIDYVMEE